MTVLGDISGIDGESVQSDTKVYLLEECSTCDFSLNRTAVAPVEACMMTPLVTRILAAIAVPLVATSCMTTYDANGRPVQSVDPAAAAVGVAAAAAIGYAIANNRNNNYYGRPYYGHQRHCRY